jgi:hypothetical protein
MLTELDREIAGWCVNADGLGRSPLPKNQPAEITMFQILEVQESPAFNDRRSFLTLRAEIAMFQISEVQESPAFTGRRSFLALRGPTRATTTSGFKVTDLLSFYGRPQFSKCCGRLGWRYCYFHIMSGVQFSTFPYGVVTS